jgi:hypothetical protein
LTALPTTPINKGAPTLSNCSTELPLMPVIELMALVTVALLEPSNVFTSDPPELVILSSDAGSPNMPATFDRLPPSTPDEFSKLMTLCAPDSDAPYRDSAPTSVGPTALIALAVVVLLVPVMLLNWLRTSGVINLPSD